jgi:type VI secretion system VasD/TssJ family lipoprotein
MRREHAHRKKEFLVGPTTRFEIFAEALSGLDAERKRRLFVSIFRALEPPDRVTFVEATRQPLQTLLLAAKGTSNPLPEQLLCERLLPDDVAVKVWRAGTGALNEDARFIAYEQMLPLLDSEAKQRVNYSLASDRPRVHIDPTGKLQRCVAANMVELDIVGQLLLNPGTREESLPVVVRTYELQGQPDLSSARLDDFLSERTDVFGKALLAVRQQTVIPGERMTETFRREKGATHIVAVALFRTVRDKRWLVVHELGPSRRCSRLLLVLRDAEISVFGDE